MNQSDVLLHQLRPSHLLCHLYHNHFLRHLFGSHLRCHLLCSHLFENKRVLSHAMLRKLRQNHLFLPALGSDHLLFDRHLQYPPSRPPARYQERESHLPTLHSSRDSTAIAAFDHDISLLLGDSAPPVSQLRSSLGRVLDDSRSFPFLLMRPASPLTSHSHSLRFIDNFTAVGDGLLRLPDFWTDALRRKLLYRLDQVVSHDPRNTVHHLRSAVLLFLLLPHSQLIRLITHVCEDLTNSQLHFFLAAVANSENLLRFLVQVTANLFPQRFDPYDRAQFKQMFPILSFMCMLHFAGEMANLSDHHFKLEIPHLDFKRELTCLRGRSFTYFQLHPILPFEFKQQLLKEYQVAPVGQPAGEIFLWFRGGLLWFNAKVEVRSYYDFGRFVGARIWNPSPVSWRIPRAVFKMLIGRPIGFRDFESIDPELGTGRATDEEKDRLVVEKFVTPTERQFEAFARGFKESCCPEVLGVLTVEELERLVNL
jgi:hypothetical protein